MPGFLLHQGATVLCTHGGQAQPLAPNPRVRVGGLPVVTQSTPYAVVCASSPACVSAQWVSAATRVYAGGAPLLLQDSQAVCTPTSAGLQVLVTQTRVRGT